MVRYLESIDADLHAKNLKGQTLLHLAVENNRYKVLVYLCAKLSIVETNSSRQTPLAYSVIVE